MNTSEIKKEQDAPATATLGGSELSVGLEPIAVNVTSEAAYVFYELLPRLPREVKRKLSCHDLNSIFKVLVVPAIDHARALDRGAPPRVPTELERVCAALLAADESAAEVALISP